jgi:hypothetical protein
LIVKAEVPSKATVREDESIILYLAQKGIMWKVGRESGKWKVEIRNAKL